MLYTSIILTILIFLILILKNNIWVSLIILVAVFYLTQSTYLSIFGIDLTPLRIIILFAMLRFIMRKEYFSIRINSIDLSVVIFLAIQLAIVSIRMSLHQDINGSFVYQFGVFIESTLIYFLFRIIINAPKTLIKFLKALVFLLIPFSLFMVFEGLTGRNVFASLGGIGIHDISIFRGGYYRAQASFRSPITAGSMGATLLPIYLGLLLEKKKVWAVIGICTSIIITIMSHSSGPLLGFLGGLLAWASWPLRKYMQNIRWGILGFFVSLQLVMKAPFWFIIARISDVIGGDGWHRANLIDQFIKHFSEWWFIGMPIKATANWAATQLPGGGVDVTNTYISAGINGGLISFCLFIWVLILCYKEIGSSVQKIENDLNEKINTFLLWGLGSVLFSHTLNFIAVTYFDQSFIMWYLLLAVISGITQSINREHDIKLALFKINFNKNNSLRNINHSY